MSALAKISLIRLLLDDGIGGHEIRYRSSHPVRDFKSKYQIEMDRKRKRSRYPRRISTHQPFKHTVPDMPDAKNGAAVVAALMAMPQRSPLVSKALKRLRRAEQRGRGLKVAQAWGRLLAMSWSRRSPRREARTKLIEGVDISGTVIVDEACGQSEVPHG